LRPDDIINLGGLITAAWIGMSAVVTIRAARGQLSRKEEIGWLMGFVVLALLALLSGARDSAGRRQLAEAEATSRQRLDGLAGDYHALAQKAGGEVGVSGGSEHGTPMELKGRALALSADLLGFMAGRDAHAPATVDLQRFDIGNFVQLVAYDRQTVLIFGERFYPKLRAVAQDFAARGRPDDELGMLIERYAVLPKDDWMNLHAINAYRDDFRRIAQLVATLGERE
jgi:hypothetical protein